MIAQEHRRRTVQWVRSHYSWLGNRIMVRKCAVGEARGDGHREKGGIVLPDTFANETLFMELLAPGAECRVFDADHFGFCCESGVGETIFTPEADQYLQCLFLENERGKIDYSYWCAPETVFEPVLIRDNAEFVPLLDCVLVEREPRSDAGIIARTERFRRFSQFGTVIAAGPECRDVDVGDRVVIPMKMVTYACGGKAYGVLRETETAEKPGVLGIVT